ncbi:MAG TPA: ComEC/Rec2 family competence protein [Bryobacterales bacterium]|nr:ComEC/Rec2 family competence protein [Bryobacterales bacterium]
MKQPLVAPLAALAIGVAAAQLAAFTFTETLLSVLLLGALACLGLRMGAPRAGAAACWIAFLACGVMLGSRGQPCDPGRVDRVWEAGRDEVDDPVRLRGWVRHPPQWAGYGDRFTLEAETVFAGSPAHGGVNVTVYRDESEPPLQLPYGTRVEFLARLRTPRNFQNPGSFDYVGYLAAKDVFLTATVRAGAPIHQNEGRGGSVWLSWIWQARQEAERRLDAMLERRASPQAGEILRALLLGQTSSLDPGTRRDFQSTGTYHALVISGLHVGAIAFSILFLLRLAMVPLIPRTLVSVLIVIAYAFFAGAALPVTRAAWMCVAYLASSLVYRQRRALNILAATALLFLFVKPQLLEDPSFQLSFLAVALIAGIAVPILERTLEPYRRALIDLWNQDRDMHVEPRVAEIRVGLRMWLDPLPVLLRLPRGVAAGGVIVLFRAGIWAAELLVVSAVIQAGLALPMAAHFQRVSWGGVSANLWIMPLVLLIPPMGLVSLLTNSEWLGMAALRGAEALAWIVDWHAKTLPAELRTPPPPLWLAIVFGLSLAAVWWSFERASRRQWVSWAAFAISLALVMIHPFAPKFSPGRFEFSAIDVGQGESLLLVMPDGQTVLVDGGGLPDYGDERTGGLDIGDSVVSPYLWSRSIRRLDVLAVTHSDADHFGGVPALLDNFEVGEVWLPQTAFAGEHRDWIETVRHRGIPVIPLEAGYSRKLGGVLFESLGPGLKPGLRDPSRNDQSLVLRARYGNHGFLLTGDIEQQAETDLVDGHWLRREEVLKVAHHGSGTSSHQDFLDQVRPTFAVISAGHRNTYGHPHPAVLARLNQLGVHVLRTDLDGLVSVTTDGRRLAIDTYRRQRAMEWHDPAESPQVARCTEPLPPTALAGVECP